MVRYSAAGFSLIHQAAHTCVLAYAPSPSRGKPDDISGFHWRGSSLHVTFRAKALVGFRASPESRSPRRRDAICRAGYIVKGKDSRMVNMPENSEGVGRGGDLLSLTKPGGGRNVFRHGHDVRKEEEKPGNMATVPDPPNCCPNMGQPVQIETPDAPPRLDSAI
jgi:hypothetical protein